MSNFDGYNVRPYNESQVTPWQAHSGGAFGGHASNSRYEDYPNLPEPSNYSAARPYLAGAVANERHYRREQEKIGYWDMKAGAVIAAATSLLEPGQTEIEHGAAHVSDPSLFEQLVSLPLVDFKALGVAASAIVLTGAARRVINSVRFAQEADHTLDMIDQSHDFIPETRQQRRIRRIATRAGQFAVTAAAAGVAYAAAEHGSALLDFAISTGILAVAGASVFTAKVAAARYERKRYRQSEQYWSNGGRFELGPS